MNTQKLRVLRARHVSFATALAVIFAGAAYSQGESNADDATPVLWIEPTDLKKRDLRRGPTAGHPVPAAPFSFIEEVKSGESPKFDVRDANGRVWRVKLGVEAQAETVATRLVWAAGYLVEDSFFYPSVRVRGLPKLSRGQEFVRRTTVTNARFEPRLKDRKEAGNWDWQKNPFAGTRELNGLKVLMVLLNNYDARKENNKVFIVDAAGERQAHHYVTDLGATLGKADGFGGHRSKNDLDDFRSTGFVMGVNEDGTVKFDYDTRPTGLGMISILHPKYYKGEVAKEKAMRSIPVEDAVWIGSILNALSDAQLRAAFDAAHYSRRVRDGYVRSIRERIRQLVALSPVT